MLHYRIAIVEIFVECREEKSTFEMTSALNNVEQNGKTVLCVLQCSIDFSQGKTTVRLLWIFAIISSEL